MEDIFHVMAMAQVPRTDISGMLNPVGAQAPVGAAAKRSYIFNSGMKATTCITDALHAMQTGGNKPVAIADRLTVGYASDIYFESRSLIAGGHAERVFAPAEAIGLGAAAGPIARDVFFFDFLPNAAAKFSEVSAHDGVAVVSRAIAGRTQATPVTVVIDTTTDLFDGARLAAVLADPGIAAAINNGTLNLVVVDSLAKFARNHFLRQGGINGIKRAIALFNPNFSLSKAERTNVFSGAPPPVPPSRKPLRLHKPAETNIQGV